MLELLNMALQKDVYLKERNVELKETDAMLRYSGGDARKQGTNHLERRVFGSSTYERDNTRLHGSEQ